MPSPRHLSGINAVKCKSYTRVVFHIKFRQKRRARLRIWVPEKWNRALRFSLNPPDKQPPTRGVIGGFSLCQLGFWPVGRVCGFFNCPAIKARVLTNRVTQAGSQWIVAQGPLSHLQFLGATKSSAKDLPLPGLEIARDSSSL